jgi:hypothetical protein
MNNGLLTLLLSTFCTIASAEPEFLLDARPQDMYNGDCSPSGNQLTLPVLNGDAPSSGVYPL